MFTTRHYRAVADVISTLTTFNDARAIAAGKFADLFEADNPRFKRDLFYRACGV